MVLELNVFLIILGVGAVCFILSYWLKQTYLYILGAVSIFIAGVAPLISDGLLINRVFTSVSESGELVYTLNTLDVSNPLLMALCFTIFGVGFVALIVFASQSNVKTRSVYHF